MAEDRAVGKRPFCVVATAGTTSTGAVDPLEELADFCEREGLWLHVDGAYGAVARLTERGKRRLLALERAHSIALDAPQVDVSADRMWLLASARPALAAADVQETPEILKDAQVDGEEMNYMYLGIQLTRHFRALKLWMSLKVFGADAMRNRD